MSKVYDIDEVMMENEFCNWKLPVRFKIRMWISAIIASIGKPQPLFDASEEDIVI